MIVTRGDTLLARKFINMNELERQTQKLSFNYRSIVHLVFNALRQQDDICVRHLFPIFFNVE